MADDPVHEQLLSRIDALEKQNMRLVQSQQELLQTIDHTDEFTQAVLDSIPDVIGVQDRDHRIIRYNAAGYAFLGITPEEAAGRKCFELIGRNSPCRTCATAEVYQTGKPARVEKHVREMDIWLDVRAYPILDEKGEIMQVVEHLRDISREKRAEIQLKTSHERLIAVLNSIDASVYVSDMESHEIIFMNQNMIDAFGRDSTGGICWKIFRNESGPCPHCPNEKLLDNDGNPCGVFVWEGVNPVTKRFYINRDRAVQWMDGRLVKLQVATDITDYKHMEAQLLQAQKMESIGTLAGGVAHDFNNMLNVISGHAELALKKITPSDPVYTDLLQIQNGAARSADITRQLLGFARKQTIAPRVMDLNDTVEKMLQMLGRLIGEDIDLLWKPAAEPCIVKIDPSQIDQILANLCVNARDAVEEGGKITIESGLTVFDQAYCESHAGFVPGEFVLLAVSDNGCGMAPDIRKKVFEPFFSTKAPGKGTGLGLSTVYGIVKQNSGFVNVYSEPGRGTTIKLYFPRQDQPVDRPSPPPARRMPRGNNETILVVEDEETILEMLETMLENLGYRVLSAAQPRRALSLAQTHPGSVDLLMTDMVMPEMNGRRLAEEMSAIFPEIRTIFMSGYTANVIAHQGVLEDGVHFLQKPFSMEALAGILRQVLDESF
jgi:PAS domain S-box-containing protein